VENLLLKLKLLFINVRVAVLEAQVERLKKMIRPHKGKVREALNPRDLMTLCGFWTCDKGCGHHYFYTSMVELETLIDRHACRKVNA
jgi:hypothetical protein